MDKTNTDYVYICILVIVTETTTSLCSTLVMNVEWLRYAECSHPPFSLFIIAINFNISPQNYKI